MKKMIKIGLLSLGLAVAQTGFSVNSALPKMSNSELQQAYEGFQNDADIVRLKHLQYWVNLIEEYHAKTGKYPFQGQSDAPIIVKIATPRQLAYFPEDPSGIQNYSMKKLVATLEKGLGRTIDEYYDPQYAPDAKPNFYLYMIDGDEYFLAVHTHQAYPFARKVAQNYYKVEVSNRYDPSTHLILTSKILFPSQPFKDASNKKIAKKAFFDDRAKQTLHQTKQSQ